MNGLNLSMGRWRDGVVLVTLWLLSCGVALLLWLQPAWILHQQAAANRQHVLRQYQELKTLTSFLPSESLPLSHTMPMLTPVSLQTPVEAYVLHETSSHVKVKGGCGERHVGFTLAWKDCQWSLVGGAVEVSRVMNQLAQQPAWIMAQARVTPQGQQWKLSIAGVTLSTLP